MNNLEQTLSIIKPDAVERNLQDEIKNEFKKNNFLIINEKKIQISKLEAEQFYKVHETKPFYGDLCQYLSSRLKLLSNILPKCHNIYVPNKTIKPIGKTTFH